MNENCSNTKDINVFVSFVWSLIFKKTHRIFLNYILKKINNSLNLDFKKNYNAFNPKNSFCQLSAK